MARRGPDRDRARCFGSTPPRQASGQAAVAQAAEEADATALRNGASAGLVLITTSSSRQLSSSAVRFACDSPLEGDGFEPPVPLWRMAPGPASAELREVPAGQLRFAPPLEESEPSVPFDRCSVTAGKNPSWEAAVSAGRRAVWLHRAGRGSERWPPVPVDLFYAAMPRRVSLSCKSRAARNQAVKFSGYWRICSCSIWARHRFLPLRRGTKSSACLPSTIIGVIPIVGKLSLRRIRPHPLSRRNCHFEALAFPVFR